MYLDFYDVIRQDSETCVLELTIRLTCMSRIEPLSILSLGPSHKKF